MVLSMSFAAEVISTDSAHPAGDAAQIATVNSNVTLSAVPSSAHVGDTITFYANASSTVSTANLTFTIYYDYYDLPYGTVNQESPVTVNTTGNPGHVIQEHVYHQAPTNYSLAGRPFYWVFVFVSDGTNNVSKFIQMFVNVNTPPQILSPPDVINAVTNQSQTVTMFVADADSDTLTVLWEFGDGTNATNVTVATPTGVWINQTHTWSPRIPGQGDFYVNYTLNVSISDGHNSPVNYSTNFSVYVPVNYPPSYPYVEASQSSVNLLADVNFTAQSSDPEGDPLTWTFNYSDGVVEVFHTGYTARGQNVIVNATHSFALPGHYDVNISVSDALVPYQVGSHNLTASYPITVVANAPPSVSSVIEVNPTVPLINGTLGYVNASVSIEANDPDGDVLTVTWNLGGGDIRTNVSAGGKDTYKFIQVMTFYDAGLYDISVTVTDGHAGHEVVLNGTVNVTSNNLPPTILAFNHEPYAIGGFAQPNETVKFLIVLTDKERNAIDFKMDFGDGSAPVYMNLTNYSSTGNITITLSHQYVKRGNFTVVLVITDNKIGLFNHTITTSLPVEVSLFVKPLVISWNWWDYTSLGLFLMIPVLLVVWALYMRRQRQHIEDEGMTYEEWKLRKEIDQERPGQEELLK